MYKYDQGFWQKGKFEGSIFNLNNLTEEDNLFYQYKYNNPALVFFKKKTMVIVSKIIKEKLSPKQKKIISLFLRQRQSMNKFRKNFQRISRQLKMDERNIYYRYADIIKKIQKNLFENQEFISMLDTCDPVIKNIMLLWIKQQTVKFKMTCPVCHRTFSKIGFKDHLIVIRYLKKHLTVSDRRHLEFLNGQERIIRNYYRAHRGYNVLWIKEIEKRSDFYLGRNWVYNYCKKIGRKQRKRTKSNPFKLSYIFQRIK